MNRRQFLVALAASGAAGATSELAGAVAGPPPEAFTGPGPYGSLDGIAADANGVILPEGFTARILAVADAVVEGTDYTFPGAPDGAACYADPESDGGWIQVRNHELGKPDGGVSALRFSPEGEVVEGYRILTGTGRNCAGGPTPWGTWLSCEEYDLIAGPAPDGGPPPDAGRVWECDPTGATTEGTPWPAMGLFSHEAVAVDPDNGQLYLTEDQLDGRFYRFTPTEYPDLSAGTLEAAKLDDEGSVTWVEIADPTGLAGQLRTQAPESTPFAAGEGAWYDEGVVVFTTKGDNRVWALDIEAQRIDVVYDAAAVDGAPLKGVDNIVVAPTSTDLFVAEDGDNMELVVITDEGEVAPFVRIEGHLAFGELTGPVFDPAGERLYVASQRGLDGHGILYEIRGPFRKTREAGAGGQTSTTLGKVGESAGGTDPESSGSDDPPVGLIVGAGAAIVAGGAAAAVALRRRRA